MNHIAIFLTLLALTSLANAGTDYQCQMDCTNKGYRYETCHDKCTTDNSQDGMARSREMQQERSNNIEQINNYGLQCRNGNVSACREVDRLQRNN